MKDARTAIAACINASPDEIFFTSGGTESDNWAIKGVLSCGDRHTIITSRIEHHAILHPCASIERMGVPVVYLPVDHDGLVAPNAVLSAIEMAHLM